MTDDQTTRRGLDSQTPNVARIWDYQLGGKDNYAADRHAADVLNAACHQVGAPDGRDIARENRQFIHRAVAHLADAGITQFIDIGAGLPSQGNVHEIAQAVRPDATVVYVDYDEVVLSHGRALLATNPSTTVIQADLRQPKDILTDPDLTRLIDLTQPVAVLLVAVLHLLTDEEDPAGIVTTLRAALAPGSALVLTHVTGDLRPGLAETVANQFTRLGVTTPLVPRSADQIRGFFTGLDGVEPGLVQPALWRPTPDTQPATRWMYAGVGRLPHTEPDTQTSHAAPQADPGATA